ncbi:MAG TPA: class I SAM-dependent methyltransferase [Dongiaceae bacterium]|jgi:demethylmenaquinone methyltransferase/2-methoxy-6-polyprenyl-1,4-benzoquinol methylase
MSDPASFGYRDVDPADKPRLVRGVFESVASRYDLMNDLMSAGIHRLWKSVLIDLLAPRPGERFVDVAGGTGDIAFRILERLGGAGGEDASVTVCDLTPAMVETGRAKAIDRGLLRGIDWIAGDAESLPFADRRFDAYTIAFGLRNVTHIDKALAEARRVLKPGGRFFCLEFSHVENEPLSRLYDLYSFELLPRLGQWVTGDRDSYQYLVESIRRFPKQSELAARIEAAGLAQVKVRNLTGGIAAIHAAWRI